MLTTVSILGGVESCCYYDGILNFRSDMVRNVHMGENLHVGASTREDKDNLWEGSDKQHQLIDVFLALMPIYGQQTYFRRTCV